MWAMSGLMGSCDFQDEIRTKMRTKNFSLPLPPKREEPQPRLGEVFLFPWEKAPSPQFSWSNAQAPWTDASQAISVTFASFPADTAAACQGHLATAAQNPDLQWAAPALINHHLPGPREATDHDTFPAPFWILAARRMSHCKYNCNWDMSAGALISLEMPSWN